MEKARAVLSVSLVASAVFGAQIAVSDRYLWYAAPSHAYGLVAFAILDLTLAVTLWRKEWLGSLLSMLLATTQALAMLGDLFTYTPSYVPQQAFQSYLLSTQYFVPLLATQPIILLLAVGESYLRYDITIIRGWLHTHFLR
jgi:hypothetical protein